MVTDTSNTGSFLVLNEQSVNVELETPLGGEVTDADSFRNKEKAAVDQQIDTLEDDVLDSQRQDGAFKGKYSQPPMI